MVETVSKKNIREFLRGFGVSEGALETVADGEILDIKIDFDERMVDLSVAFPALVLSLIHI